MAEVDFASINMTGCDESKVRKNSGRIYILPFSLSAKPPREWTKIFDGLWRTRRKQSETTKAQAHVKKGDLIVECQLDEIKGLFPELQAAIYETNQKYLEQLQQRADKDAKKRQKREGQEQAERQAVHEALDGLDFSQPTI